MSLSSTIKTFSDGRSMPSTSQDLLSRAEALKVVEMHIKVEPAIEFRAIVAIHSTRLGPALGGCRCVPYSSTEAALQDAMRLARSMSYKATILHLPFGGGKAVLMRPRHIADREAYFEHFGEFIAVLYGATETAPS